MANYISLYVYICSRTNCTMYIRQSENAPFSSFTYTFSSVYIYILGQTIFRNNIRTYLQYTNKAINDIYINAILCEFFGLCAFMNPYCTYPSTFKMCLACFQHITTKKRHTFFACLRRVSLQVFCPFRAKIRKTKVFLRKISFIVQKCACYI
jgi:hypothetical protein